jgi:hypothetical protein
MKYGSCLHCAGIVAFERCSSAQTSSVSDRHARNGKVLTCISPRSTRIIGQVWAIPAVQ